MDGIFRGSSWGSFQGWASFGVEALRDHSQSCSILLRLQGVQVLSPGESITRKMSSYTPTEEEKQRFMSRAIELSEEGVSEGHGGPYGSVIVKDGEIVGQLAVLAKDCMHV